MPAMLALMACAAASSIFGAEPMINDVQPRGGQRGKTFTLTIKGESLEAGADLITSLPCTITKLASPRDAETPNSELAYLIHVPDDDAVGAYPLRVRTAGGLSNVEIFAVSDLPEVAEKEPNDSIAEAQPVTLPVAVSGTLKGPDQDFFSFTATAHQRLVIEVEARRIGSAIDPAIEVFDSAGRLIAQNDDAPGLGVDSRLDITFPKAGKYFVAVHDSKFSDQAENFYRLKIGSWAYAEGMYPLGWQRGKPVAVTLFGGNLAQPVVVHPNLDVPEGRDFVAVNVPGPKPVGSLPLQFRVGDLPEILAGTGGSVTPLEPSTVTNGRILKPGEVDRYGLKVSPGEDWTLELDSATLGTSLLYGSLAVTDAQGKKLAVTDVSSGADPCVAFKVPDKVHEVTLAVSDVRGQGGPAYGYRLVARPEAGDFTLRLITPYINVPARGTAALRVVAERHGYYGPIRVSIPNLPDDLIFAGGNIIEEVNHADLKRQPNTPGYVTLTAKADAKPRTVELAVWGDGGSPDHPIRRRAIGPGLIFTVKGEEIVNTIGESTPTRPAIYPWLGIELPVALGAPLPAELQVAERNVRAVQGMDFPIPFQIVKQGAGMATGDVGGFFPGIRELGLKNRAEMKGQDKGEMMLGSTLETPLVKFDLVPNATVEVNGKEQTIVAPAVTIQLVRAYTLELKSPRVVLKGGGKVELAGVVHREPIFPGTVKISVGDPPDKVSCGPVEVPNGRSDFSLTCEATSGVQEGEFEVHLVSTAIVPGGKDKREYTYPPVATQMIIGGEKVAANAKGVGAQ
jgi:hypothetical protein